MKDRKIEAIAVLEAAFKDNPVYKKKWTDYIELMVTEELSHYQRLNVSEVKKIRKGVAERVIRLFESEWWEMQSSATEK